ncbi:hypothetical protein [Mucilaginibacter sp.]|uniref:hypothetical protein n=1 Tax=Mucilaginibacter sp. TaxID=1882438 RepID=UPI00262346E3|nr:hypothetical protein [Mucilaginibacter sp.]MDB4924635.1 hypothetical protein [Mucilaginibacter sp.]
MKSSIVLFAFVLLSSLSKAQTKEGDKIYWTALEKYTLSLDTMGFKKAEEDKVKTIYLEKPDFVDSIPSVINGYKIILITNENQRKTYKDHKGLLTHTKLFPISVHDNVAEISFVPYRGRLKKRNHYMLSVSDGTIIYFKFDSNKNQFVFSKVKNWGI